MKVTYHFQNDEIVEIETEEKYAMAITTSRKDEAASDRRYHAHTYSYDAAIYEGMEYAAPDTPESMMVNREVSAETSTRYAAALSLLTETQKKRFLMYASGLSTHEIARQEGSNQKSVYESVESARKKLLKFYGNTPSKRG